MSHDIEKLQEIGKNAMASIREMVEALDIETAAEAYARDLPALRCVDLLTGGAGIDAHAEDSIDELREAVAVNIADGTIEPEDFEFDEDEARDRIMEDPLSLEIRSGWCQCAGDMVAEEYRLLLGTGGPAVQIVGELNEYAEPVTAVLQAQDWFLPWTDYRSTSEEDEILLRYAQCFCFE